MKVLIFANGEINDYFFLEKYLDGNILIISCDGGLKHIKNLNLIPDFLIGDFDSANKNDLEFYKSKNIPVINFPVEKDFTDMEFCLDFAIEKNPKEILIFGGIGSRIDHTLGNIFLLQKSLENNITTKLINKNTIIQLINKKIIIEKSIGNIISLIPYSEKVTGIQTKGLKYPLKKETLFKNSSRGISNEFENNKCEIQIEKGLLLIIETKE